MRADLQRLERDSESGRNPYAGLSPVGLATKPRTAKRGKILITWRSSPCWRQAAVLGDFSNTTGDPVFNDTLRTALNVSLRQSPFLNVLSNSEVMKTLKQMTLPANTRLTPEIARELCRREGSQAYLAG